MKHVDVSVVIPTRNRRQSLERTLRALARQRFASGTFEVVVALDGDDEANGSGLAALGLPYHLSVVSSADPKGAAAARNQGAAAAGGELLVFLDDDIEADQGLISAHVRGHQDGAQLTIGYLPLAVGGADGGFFEIALRGWWEAMFAALRRPGHRHWFRDVLTGNCAVAASTFRELEGFDAAFRCHEDYEFGVRLVARGAVVRFAEAAAGIHHEATRLPRAFERKREEGRADVQMLRKHPHLAPSLPIGWFDRHATRLQFLLRRLVFERPSAGRALASTLTRSLPVLEAGRFRGRWTRRLQDLLNYWYWRGAAEEIPGPRAYTSFLHDCHARSTWSPLTLEVDLANGLDLVMAQVDRRRPDGLRVMLHPTEVGTIAPAPGAEGLTGQHLKAALARELAGAFLTALGRTGAIPAGWQGDVFAATGPVPTDVARF